MKELIFLLLLTILKRKMQKILSDEILFGKTKEVRVTSVEAAKKSGKNFLLSQVPTKNLGYKSENINSLSFKRNYVTSLIKGEDSGELLTSIARPDYLSLVGNGTLFVTDDDENKLLLDLRQSMINQTSPDNQSKPNNTNSLGTNVKQVALTFESTGRNRLIKVVAHVKESLISSNASLIFSVDAISPKSRIVGENLSINVNHSQNINDFYSPKKIPIIDGMVGRTPAKKLFVKFKIEDLNIDAVDLYYRKISESFQIGESGFTKLLTHRVNPRRRGQTVYRDIKMPISDKCFYVFRAISKNSQGIEYGNFSAFSISSRSYVPHNAVIVTSPDDKGIKVNISKVAPTVSGVSVIRRDASFGKKNFKNVENFDVKMLRELGRENIQSTQSYTYIDEMAKKDRLYEYRCRLYHTNGIVTDSSISSFETRLDRMNLVSVSVSNKKIEKLKRSDFLGSGQKGSAKITFSVETKIKENDLDLLLSILRDTGVEGFYSGDINEVKDKFQNIVSLEVSRTDLGTGETVALGNFSASGEIVDDGSVVGFPGPKFGTAYSYRIMPCLVSPEEVSQQLETSSLLKTETFSSTVSIKNPAILSSVKSNILSKKVISVNAGTARQKYESEKLKKSFSTFSLSKGTLVSPQAQIEREATSSLMSEHRTGDFVDVKIGDTKSSGTIIPKSVTYGGHGCANISWRFSQEGASNGVDYFIVSGEKQGVKSFIGCCHGSVSVGSTFKYVDLQNIGFVGTIKYYVTPVFLDGTVGSTKVIGSIELLERNTEKLRRK